MKRFQFTLQTLLAWREQKEQTAQRRYAQALGDSERVRVKMRSMEADLERCWEAVREQIMAGISAGSLARLRSYTARVEERRKQLQREYQTACRIAEQARCDMVCAMQNRKALEHYRARRRLAFDLAAARGEQRFLDDLAARPSALGAAMPACKRAVGIERHPSTKGGESNSTFAGSKMLEPTELALTDAGNASAPTEIQMPGLPG
ncbi:MAG: flagellar export protein FliJ [Candidatus Omnitrophica bacterium]|nr:flagellar export protein FliJ [Candidatus Omnitrophota bacterium]